MTERASERAGGRNHHLGQRGSLHHQHCNSCRHYHSSRHRLSRVLLRGYTAATRRVIYCDRGRRVKDETSNPWCVKDPVMAGNGAKMAFISCDYPSLWCRGMGHQFPLHVMSSLPELGDLQVERLMFASGRHCNGFGEKKELNLHRRCLHRQLVRGRRAPARPGRRVFLHRHAPSPLQRLHRDLTASGRYCSLPRENLACSPPSACRPVG